ncbi:MAG: hypothetical protein FWB96_03265 [Defluviitaleaceae bacterium]|nr:hypothetical protein [Defluviitaleaceae bacterium]MCL2263911.1 hypothetical protein [Defluviitaleaceae bacterium]
MIKTIVAWCVFGLLLAAGFSEARTVSRFSGVSLRFDAPICGETAFRARRHAVNADTFWPTFWGESAATLDAGARQTNTAVINFSGDASLVWNAEFIAGTAPSSADDSGVAVSESLARGLWGSVDIVGMGVYVNGEPRTVRGVFSGTKDLALVSFHIEDTAQSFTVAELSGNITRARAESFAIAAGLGRPTHILTGGAGAVAWFMAVLPVLIPALYGFVLLVVHIKKHYPRAAAPLFFAGLVLFAVLLPFLLNRAPDWLIPTRWSDFAFWGELANQATASLREFLSVNPTLRDVELRIHLLRQGIIMLFSSCVGISISCRLSFVGNFRQHITDELNNLDNYDKDDDGAD